MVKLDRLADSDNVFLTINNLQNTIVELKNKKADINLNSWTTFLLDRQPSKAPKFNRQLSMLSPH